jgi:hypothetical protein
MDIIRIVVLINVEHVNIHHTFCNTATKIAKKS